MLAMRIIPKKTNVQMQFFRNIGVVDMLVILGGCMLAFTILLSDLPFRLILFIIVIVLTIGLTVSFDEDKPYKSVYNALLYSARQKQYVRKAAGAHPDSGKMSGAAGKRGLHAGGISAASIEDITPFTGVQGKYIEYAGEYYGAVIQIMPVEFRLYSAERQNQMIDRTYASVLRAVQLNETAAMVITGALENREMNGYLCLRDEGLRLVKTGRSVQLQNVLGTEPLQFVLAADKNAADLIQGADRLIPQEAAQEESEGSGYSEGNSYSGESEGAAEAGVPGSTDTAEMSGNMQDNTADGTGAVQTSDKKSGFPAAILLTLLPVLFIIAFWKLFAKAGEAGWKSLVPFLNLYILYKISWGKGILFLLGFIPFVNIIIYFMTMLKLGDAFGKKLPFKLGLLFLPNVFMLILGFDHSEYLGSGHKS